MTLGAWNHGRSSSSMRPFSCGNPREFAYVTAAEQIEDVHELLSTSCTELDRRNQETLAEAAHLSRLLQPGKEAGRQSVRMMPFRSAFHFHFTELDGSIGEGFTGCVRLACIQFSSQSLITKSKLKVILSSSAPLMSV